MSKTSASLIVIILFVGSFFVFMKFNNKQNITDNNVASAISSQDIEVTPIEHATMVLKWGGKVVYVDPVGGASAFAGEPEPDLIFVTDIHSDHLSVETLQAVSQSKTSIITPMAVAEKIPNTVLGTLLVMKNGEKTNEKTTRKIDLRGFLLEAIPMYNLPEKKDAFHTKGRGNGYVLEKDGKRIYISGDTSDIPEMRNLENIDMAFVAMNLPYTMSVDSAASGVLAFKPKQVFPYHYRGTDGLSDVNKFQELVNEGDSSIEVTLLDWYKK